MRQWLRKTRVTFQGSGSGFIVNPDDEVTPKEMHVSFSVEKTISNSPNKFEVKLWNLNPDHRNSVGKELDVVTLEAGYMPPEGGGNLSVIAKGFIRDVQHDRDGPHIITTISCGDGDQAHRKATVSKTYPAETPVKDIVEGIYNDSMKSNGVDKGEFVFPEGMRTTKRPYSMCGSAVRELNTLGRSNGFYWSIQNGVMETIPTDGFLPGEILINKDSGMIGAPTITDNGVKVKCLLNPAIRPNRTIKVESEVLEMNSKDSVYRVSAVTFDGDNTDGDFVADVHGEALTSEGKVDEGVK